MIFRNFSQVLAETRSDAQQGVVSGFAWLVGDKKQLLKAYLGRGWRKRPGHPAFMILMWVIHQMFGLPRSHSLDTV